MMDTRQLFFALLEQIAETEPKLMFLTGDLGYSFMEDFAEKYPDRFINCGIAEQNMVGVAAGLAHRGMKPVVYSGAKFLLYRAIEQIRDDVVYQGLDVKFVGTGAAGFLGFTHNLADSENPKHIVTRIPDFRYAEPRDYGSMKTALTLPGATFIKL